MHIKILPNTNQVGKLADAELHFGSQDVPGADGILSGLKLIGFSIWERRGGSGRNVVFPSRQYEANGERRSFALLRPTDDVTQTRTLRDLILKAYEDYEDAAREETSTENSDSRHDGQQGA